MTLPRLIPDFLGRPLALFIAVLATGLLALAHARGERDHATRQLDRARAARTSATQRQAEAEKLKAEIAHQTARIEALRAAGLLDAPAPEHWIAALRQARGALGLRNVRYEIGTPQTLPTDPRFLLTPMRVQTLALTEPDILALPQTLATENRGWLRIKSLILQHDPASSAPEKLRAEYQFEWVHLQPPEKPPEK